MPHASIPPSESAAPKVADFVKGMLEDTAEGLAIEELNEEARNKKQETPKKAQLNRDGPRKRVTDESRLNGPLATISPAECLRFDVDDHTRETACDVLKIFNHSTKHNIAYKVKSTSPSFYRVGQSMGLITPEETAEVDLFLRPDFDGSIHPKAANDQFLIQIMQVGHDVTSSLDIQNTLNKVDKQATTYMQHKMLCTVSLQEESEANWPLLDTGWSDVSRLVAEAEATFQNNDLIEKMEKQIELEAQCIRKEIQVVKSKAVQENKKTKALEKQQSTIFRFIQFEVFMIAFLVLALFVLCYMPYNGQDDLAHCTEDLSTDCIIPTLPMQ